MRNGLVISDLLSLLYISLDYWLSFKTTKLSANYNMCVSAGQPRLRSASGHSRDLQFALLSALSIIYLLGILDGALKQQNCLHVMSL